MKMEEEEQNDNIVREKTSEEEDISIEFEHNKTTTTVDEEEEEEKEERAWTTRWTTSRTASGTTPGGQDSVLNYVEELSFRSSVLDGKTDLSFRNLHTQEQVSNKDRSFFDSTSRSVIVRLPCEMYIYIFFIGVYIYIYICTHSLLLESTLNVEGQKTKRPVSSFAFVLLSLFLPVWNSTVCSRKGPRVG